MTAPTETAWQDRVFAGFDLETTGVDPQNDRIVTASIVYINPDGTRNRPDRNWLVNPGIAIPEQASDVHGISTEKAIRDGMASAQAVSEIRAEVLALLLAGTPLVVFNASYDLTMLSAESVRHGAEPLAAEPGFQNAIVLDPLVIDRAVDRFRRGKRTLVAMSEHYGVTLEDAHSSDADSVASCLIARKLVAGSPQLSSMSVGEAMKIQSKWKSDWAAGFQKWLRNKGNADAVISGQWPIEALAA